MTVLIYVSFFATVMLLVEGVWILYTTRTPRKPWEIMSKPAYGERKRICIIFPSYKDVVPLDRWLEWSKGEPVKYIIAEDGGRNNDKWKGQATIIHRKERSGFKAGAVDNVLDYLVRQGEDLDYVMVFDADHIPYNTSIKEIYGYLNKEVIQFFWLDGLPLTSPLNWLTFSSRYYSNWNIYNRSFANLTGSAIAIRFDIIREDMLRLPYTITEDYALTLYTLCLRKLKVTVIPFNMSIGSSPKHFPAFQKQQIRWAEGTIRDARIYFWKLLEDPEMPIGGKIDFLMHINLYLQGVWTLTTLALLVSGLGYSIWLVPLLLFQAVAYIKTMAIAPKRYWPLYFLLNYYMALVQVYALLRAVFVYKGNFQVTDKVIGASRA